MERQSLLKLLTKRRRIPVSPAGGKVWTGIWQGQPVCVFQAGMGESRLHKVLPAFLREFRPQQLILTGVCGGLYADLRTGDVVLAEAVALDSADPAEAEPLPLRILAAEFVSASNVRMIPQLLSVRTACLTASDKEQLWQKTGAWAVDMEGYACAELAFNIDIPLLILKALSDDSATEIPPAVLSFVDETGEIVWRNVIATLIKNPRLIFTLRDMNRGSQQALRQLLNVLTNYSSVIQTNAAE